jgi:predicted Rossmann-fold nucleotide-binding protein
VAGARACTAYGSCLAAELGGSLADQGFLVIAGGAFGMDAAAHRGALGADGATIAVRGVPAAGAAASARCSVSARDVADPYAEAPGTEMTRPGA